MHIRHGIDQRVKCKRNRFTSQNLSNIAVYFKVDDIDISTMEHMDAVNVLRSTEQVVKLTVLRRPEGVSSPFLPFKRTYFARK